MKKTLLATGMVVALCMTGAADAQKIKNDNSSLSGSISDSDSTSDSGSSTKITGIGLGLHRSDFGSAATGLNPCEITTHRAWDTILGGRGEAKGLDKDCLTELQGLEFLKLGAAYDANGQDEAAQILMEIGSQYLMTTNRAQAAREHIVGIRATAFSIAATAGRTGRPPSTKDILRLQQWHDQGFINLHDYPDVLKYIEHPQELETDYVRGRLINQNQVKGVTNNGIPVNKCKTTLCRNLASRH